VRKVRGEREEEKKKLVEENPRQWDKGVVGPSRIILFVPWTRGARWSRRHDRVVADMKSFPKRKGGDQAAHET
jgi:hypothetical protein